MLIRQRLSNWSRDLWRGLTDHLFRMFEWVLLYSGLVAFCLALTALLSQPPHVADLIGPLTIAVITTLGWVLRRRLRRHIPDRRTERYLVAGTSLAILAVVTTSALLATSFDRGIVFHATVSGLGAWSLATALLCVVLFLAGTALNSDLASIRMFAGRRFLLELYAAIYLFLVALLPLLFWPEFSTALTSGTITTQSMIVSIANPASPINNVLEIVLTALGALGAFAALLAAAFTVYWAISSKFYAGVKRPLWHGLRLFWSNYRYRFGGRTTPLWPRKAPSNETSKTDSSLDRFGLTINYPALSLAFGLWAPLIIRNGILAPDDVYNVGSYNWIAVIVLILYLVGGVDIWFQAVDVAGEKGTIYTLGYWLATAAMYWPATILPTMLVSVAPIIHNWLLNSNPNWDQLSAMQSTLATEIVVLYRAILAVSTLFAGIVQIQRSGSDIPLERIRGVFAALPICVFVGYMFGPLAWSSAPVTPLVRIILLALLFAFVIVVSVFLALSTQMVQGSTGKYEISLVTSSSLAIVPLLLSNKILAAKHNGDTLALQVKNPGKDLRPIQLSIRVMGSEEEVAFEANRWLKELWHRQADMVITDMQTAVGMFASDPKIDRSIESNEQLPTYQMVSVVGSIPWHGFDAVGSNHGEPPRRHTQITLDTGSIRYKAPFQAAGGPELPRGPSQATSSTRWTSASAAARYAVHNDGDVSRVIVPEPYFSWASRKIRQLKRSVGNLVTLSYPYVLLARTKGPSQNIVRLVYEMIIDGQIALHSGAGIVDHQRLQPMFSAYKELIDPNIDLDLSDIKRALMQSSFRPTFGEECATACDWILSDLQRAELDTNAPMIRDHRIGHPNIRIAPDARRTGGPDSSASYPASIVLWERLRTNKFKLVAEDYFFFAEGVYRHKLCRQARIGDGYVTPMVYEQALREMQHYLFDLLVIPLTNKEGELRKLLEPGRRPVHGRPTLLASTNLGDTVLVYLVDTLVTGVSSTRLATGEFLANGNAGIAQEYRYRSRVGPKIRDIGASVVIPALVAQIGDDENSVTRSLESMGINIELAFTIHNDGQAQFVFALKEPDLVKIHLDTQGLASLSLKKRPLDPIFATRVSLREQSKPERLALHVEFNHPDHDDYFCIDDTYHFLCGDRSTWTLSRGDANQWDRKIEFNRIELLFPRELEWRCKLHAWLDGRLPQRVANWKKRQFFLSAGGDGLSVLNDRSQWTVSVEPSDDY